MTETTSKAPIIVEAGIDQIVVEGASVNFEGNFTASGSHTYSFNWNFGDGNTAIGISVFQNVSSILLSHKARNLTPELKRVKRRRIIKWAMLVWR